MVRCGARWVDVLSQGRYDLRAWRYAWGRELAAAVRAGLEEAGVTVAALSDRYFNIPISPISNSDFHPALCSATNTRRSTFPAIVFGRVSRNSTCTGLLYGASFCRQYTRSSSTVGLVPGAPDNPRLHHLTLDGVRNSGNAYFLDARVSGKHFFDFARPHLIAAGLDQILLAIDDEQKRVVIEVPEIAGVQPGPGAMWTRG